MGLEYTPTKDLAVSAHVYGNTIERRLVQPTESVSLYNGTRAGVDTQVRYNITPQHGVVAGAEARTESFRGEYSSTFFNSLDKGESDTHSVFAQYLFNSADKKLNVTAGARLDNHSVAGNFATYRVTAAYTLPEQWGQLHSSLGTGAKAPSLFQLLSQYGNKDLKPEKSTSVDAGWRFNTLSKHVQHDVTVFRNDYKQLIAYTSGYENVARARTQGVEFTTDADITSSWRTRLMYTYTQANDLDKDKQLLRRPKHIAAWQNDWQLGNWSPRLEARYNGAQPDYDPKRNKSYVVVGAGLRYNLKDLLGHESQWFARVDNVLDKEYSEVAGYNAPKLSAFSGIEFKF